MRIAILWIELTGYLNACLKELASRPGIELFVARRTPGAEAPFADEQFQWIAEQLIWRSPSDLNLLHIKLEQFRPDLIVIAGWAVPEYRKAARRWKSRAVRVMTMDNCWRGSLSQRFGSIMSPFLVKTLADAIWVPGDRQAAFATRLRFDEDRILRGLYSCDYFAFSQVHEQRARLRLPLNRAFVFAGRLIEKKGITTLAAAYRRYRNSVRDPWPMLCLGRGPMVQVLAEEPGITVEGFVQPAWLPAKLAGAACLVLPSTFEPWALVVHEAAAAGLAILASDAVGSVPHLVEHGENGFIFRPNDVQGLSHLMERLSLMSNDSLTAMSFASASLARQFTPVLWTDTILGFVETFRDQGALCQKLS